MKKHLVDYLGNIYPNYGSFDVFHVRMMLCCFLYWGLESRNNRQRSQTKQWKWIEGEAKSLYIAFADFL